jgi:hypothetical protein
MLPLASVAGVLLPCDNRTWITELDPKRIVGSLSGRRGEELGTNSVVMVPGIADEDRVWWHLRLHSILSRIVEYHVVS